MPRRLSHTTSSSTVPSSPTDPPTLMAIVLPTYWQMYGSASSSVAVVSSAVGTSGRVSTVFHNVAFGEVAAPRPGRTVAKTKIDAHRDLVAVHLGACVVLRNAGGHSVPRDLQR